MERGEAAGGDAQRRRFGALLTVACALVAVQAYRHGASAAMAAGMAGAATFAGLATFAPKLLARPMRAWLRLGEALHKVVSPIILAAIFFGVVVPTGFFLRLARRTPLLLERRAGSYWIDRPGPQLRESMKNLF